VILDKYCMNIYALRTHMLLDHMNLYKARAVIFCKTKNSKTAWSRKKAQRRLCNIWLL